MPIQATSLKVIWCLAAHSSPGNILCYAGTPVPKAPPSGIVEILRLRNQGSVKVSVGLTMIKSAAAFKAPTIDPVTTFQRVGHQVQHFASLKQTTSEDAVHDSYYPAPGLHKKPASEGKNEYWEVTDEFSELVKEGELEHLRDARRAYEITYFCLEKEINKLAGRQFGPASTPDAAIDLAIAELKRRLPTELGVDPANWVAKLDALLGMSTNRDKNLWHAVGTKEFRQDGNKRIEVLEPSTFFQLKVPSAHVVHY